MRRRAKPLPRRSAGYRVGRELGRGAMGVVYEETQARRSRAWARPGTGGGDPSVEQVAEYAAEAGNDILAVQLPAGRDGSRFDP